MPLGALLLNTLEKLQVFWREVAILHLLEQLQAEFARVRADMEKDARRASKLDAKATLLTAGYQRRAAELQTKVDEVYEALAAKAAELHAFQRLHAQELRSAPLRIEARAAELEVQTQREQALQARYAAAVAVRAASPWFTRLAF